MTDIEIVGFDPQLLGQASALRAAEFGGTPEQNHRYLVWKYLHNPYIEVPVVHFALHAGEVIGMRASMGTCWEAGGSRHVIPTGGDLVVRRQFRRRGISRQMFGAAAVELRSRGFDYSISLSAGRMGAPSALASGWTEVAVLEMCELGSTSPARWRRLVGFGRKATTHAARIVLPTGSTEKSSPFIALERAIEPHVAVCTTAPAAELAAIAARAAPSARLRHVRDEAYFDWRLGNPLSTYRLLLTPDAYLILQWSGYAARVNVVDWRSATPEALSDLIRATVRYVANLYVWVASLDSHIPPMPGSDVKSRTGSRFVLRNFRDDGHSPVLGGLELDRLASWHLQMLDSDEF